MGRRRRALLLGLVFLCAPLAMTAPGQWPAAVVEWAPDGKVLISARGVLARFDLDSDQQELLDHSAASFALSPDGHRLAVAGPNRLELRRYPDFQLLAVLAPSASASGQPVDFYSLAWAAPGSTLAAGTRAGHILLWDVESRELWGDLALQPPSPVTRLVFSADGRRLLSAFEDGRAVLWDIARRQVQHRFDLRPTPPGQPGADTQTTVAAFSPDGRYILATQVGDAEAHLVLLDLEGRVEWRRRGYGMEFTRAGEALLALTPPFRIAVLYRTSDAQALRVFEPPEAVRVLYLVRLSPDEKFLLGVGEDYRGQVLIVWEFATARVLNTRR